MARAGDYPTRLEWFKRAKGERDEFGQRFDSYTPSQGFLWGAVEDVAASRVTEKASEKQQTTATIRLRNEPAVRPGDLLRDAGTGDEWTVLTAVAGDNEVICEVEQ